MLPSLGADSPGVENCREAGNAYDVILDDQLLTPGLESASLGGEYLDWDGPDLDLTDFLDLQTNETIASPSSRSSAARHSSPLTDQRGQVRAIFSPNVSIPPVPSSTVRSLHERPKSRTGAQRIANLILHTLKSYPLMMLRNNILPPFIHPSFISFDFGNGPMEPLTNCISLMHMLGSGIQGSRKLFWKNVRLECERLYQDVCHVSDIPARAPQER